MERIALRTFFLAALTVTTLIMSCSKKNDDAPTEVEKVTQLLSQGSTSWSLPQTGGVLIGGNDYTQDLFKNFTIKFNANGTFTTSGTSPVWLATDTWRFKDETAKVIIRGQDQKEVTITSISATELRLSLTWDHTTTSQEGRSKSLAGLHEFYLKK